MEISGIRPGYVNDNRERLAMAITSGSAPTTRDGTAEPVPVAPGYRDRKADHLGRLRKIEGQVRGVARMVEDERYCIDVLTQINAVTSALQQVALGLLDDHMRHCVMDAARSDVAAGDEKIDELVTALRRTMRI